MRYFGILAALFFAATLNAQSYLGSIALGKSTISYNIKLAKIEGQTKAFFTSIEMNAYDIPCQGTSVENGVLTFYVISDYFTYEYKFTPQGIDYTGQLTVYSNETEELLRSFETQLIHETAAASNNIEKEDVAFTPNGLTLHGTLWKPKNGNNRGIFFVTSSQGNDRSGTNAEASYFSSLGYTVFNYDKRGTGNSEGDWQSASIEDLSSDDINAITYFAQKTQLSLSEIGIKGSSQGGIKIPYILSKLPELKFGVSISCPSGTLLESDLNSWKNSNANEIGQKNIKTAVKVQKAGFNYVANNISYEKLSSIELKYSKEDWFKHIWIPEKDIQKDDKLNFSGLPYFKEVNQPVLVIQGLADKVIPENSYSIIEKALKKSNSKVYDIVKLENTTHSMTYLDTEFPYFQLLTPDYLKIVTNWISKIEAK